MKIEDSSIAPRGPKAERRLLLLALLLLLIPPVWAGVETLRNQRGPGAEPPSVAAGAAGRALLERALVNHNAAGWATRPVVDFGVTCEKLFGGTLQLLVSLAPATRAARIGVMSSGEDYRYDGATKAIAAVGADSTHAGALRTLGPSIIFWSLVPYVLQDSTALVWQLSDVRRGGAVSNRLAVRWPGAAEWYIFELRPDDGRIRAVEFRSAGTPALVRWRGEVDGAIHTGAVTLPGVWRFRPASPFLGIVFGLQDVYTFRYSFLRSPDDIPNGAH